MPKFAANLSLMFKEVDFLDRFAEAARAGFTGVEFLFPYDHEPGEIAERLKANDLTQALFNCPPGNWEAGERGIGCLPGREAEFRDGVERAVTYARALDCKLLHCMAGLAPEGADRDELRDTYVRNLRHAAEVCGRAGIRVLIEPINTRDIPGYFVNYTQQAAELVRDVGAPNVAIQFDIYHAQIMQGDLARTIERYIGQIAHMQLADNPGRHEPGTGEINYPFLFDVVDRIGYRGWIGCEYNPAGRTTEGLGWFEAARSRAAAPAN